MSSRVRPALNFNIPDDMPMQEQFIYLHRGRPPLCMQFCFQNNGSDRNNGFVRVAGCWHGRIETTNWRSGKFHRYPPNGYLKVWFRYFEPSPVSVSQILFWSDRNVMYQNPFVRVIELDPAVDFWSWLATPPELPLLGDSGDDSENDPDGVIMAAENLLRNVTYE